MPIEDIIKASVRYTGKDTDYWLKDKFYIVVIKQLGTGVYVKHKPEGLSVDASLIKFSCLDDFLTSFDICTKL